MLQIATAVLAVGAAAALGYGGRHDITRPAVAFGVPWFAAVALAQLSLTDFSEPWDLRFSAVALGGGLAFVVAAILAAGTRGARGAIKPPVPGDYDSRRMLVAAVVLLLGGVVGWWLASRTLGGVPLFSGDIDAVRSRAYGESEVAIPSYVTFLTDGCYLGGWALLAFAAMRWRSLSRGARALTLLGVGAAGVGALAGGSRNVLLFAVAVPLLVVYAATNPLPRRLARSLVAVGICMAVVFSAFFLIRTNANVATSGYLANELEKHPRVLRPLLPVYVAATYPLEAERRLLGALPDRFEHTGGSATLASFPDAFFPDGKAAYGPQLGALTNTDENGLYWTVATYQGRTLSDFGSTAIFPFSILLGLAFGLAYRACRAGRGFLPLAGVAVLAYYSAFMTYDNLLSFSVIAVYDLTVVAALELICRAPQRATRETASG